MTADDQRAEMRGRWEAAAVGWGRRAQEVRDMGLPVSSWLIDQLALQPGHRVLELAAGPGDTGFLAAELIQPGGTLICSDGAEAMLALARERARALEVPGVEFKRLELEWIDLPAADVDAIICRWGLMLILDPAAAVQECRRVLRPGGRLAVAVWDEPARNPWATIPARALAANGHVPLADPLASPGMFALAAPGVLAELLQTAGFTDVVVDRVELPHTYDSVERYLEETVDLSSIFRGTFGSLTADERDAVVAEVSSLAEPYTDPDRGGVRLPGSSLVGAADA